MVENPKNPIENFDDDWGKFVVTPIDGHPQFQVHRQKPGLGMLDAPRQDKLKLIVNSCGSFP